jgi:hypothetical protein
VDEPVVFISEFRLAPGAEPAFRAAFAEALAVVAATKPRTRLYAAYMEEHGRAVRIVHAFPDASAMATHFEGAADRARAVSSIIAPRRFEVYGRGPESSIVELGRDASEAGAKLVLSRRPIGGFLR